MVSDLFGGGGHGPLPPPLSPRRSACLWFHQSPSTTTRSGINASLTLKKALEVDGLVVHWDGKLLQGLTSKDLVERLTMLVFGRGTTQLLGVPKLMSGTGGDDTGDDTTIRRSFDTIARNTGRKKTASGS